MKQFVVPQFIDVENKILGPLSVRQFLIILGAGLLIFVWYELFSFWLFAVVSIFTLAIAIVFAFVKINSQPFHIFALSMLQTIRRPNLKVWHHQMYENIKEEKKKEEAAPVPLKQEVDPSKLTEISLMVDTSGQYAGEASPEEEELQANDPTKPLEQAKNKTLTGKVSAPPAKKGFKLFRK